MTQQKEFPLIVNGQYWKKVTVDESIIYRGILYIPIFRQRLNISNKDNPSIMSKHAIFQLAEIRQNSGNFEAKWITGFWLVDDAIYIGEDNRLYLKDER